MHASSRVLDLALPFRQFAQKTVFDHPKNRKSVRDSSRAESFLAPAFHPRSNRSDTSRCAPQAHGQSRIPGACICVGTRLRSKIGFGPIPNRAGQKHPQHELALPASQRAIEIPRRTRDGPVLAPQAWRSPDPMRSNSADRRRHSLRVRAHSDSHDTVSCKSEPLAVFHRRYHFPNRFPQAFAPRSSVRLESVKASRESRPRIQSLWARSPMRWSQHAT